MPNLYSTIHTFLYTLIKICDSLWPLWQKSFLQNKPNLTGTAGFRPAFKSQKRRPALRSFGKSAFSSQKPQTHFTPPFTAHAKCVFSPQISFWRRSASKRFSDVPLRHQKSQSQKHAPFAAHANAVYNLLSTILQKHRQKIAPFACKNPEPKNTQLLRATRIAIPVHKYTLARKSIPKSPFTYPKIQDPKSTRYHPAKVNDFKHRFMYNHCHE